MDIFAPTYWYTLEEVIRESKLGVARRAILWKWLQWGPEKFQIKPDAADQSEFQETCEHLGYTSYTIEPIQRGGWWIIPAKEN